MSVRGRSRRRSFRTGLGILTVDVTLSPLLLAGGDRILQENNDPILLE